MGKKKAAKKPAKKKSANKTRTSGYTSNKRHPINTLVQAKQEISRLKSQIGRLEDARDELQLLLDHYSGGTETQQCLRNAYSVLDGASLELGQWAGSGDTAHAHIAANIIAEHLLEMTEYRIKLQEREDEFEHAK